MPWINLTLRRGAFTKEMQHAVMAKLTDTLMFWEKIPDTPEARKRTKGWVYVVDEDSRVHLKTIQVGITTATSADILGGISDGDQVVVDGTDRLVEGAVVEFDDAAVDSLACTRNAARFGLSV